MSVRQWLIPILVLMGVYAFSMHGLKGGPVISVGDMATLLKSEPRPVLVDLRPSADFERATIAGAISVPQPEFKDRLGALGLQKDAVIVLYDTDGANAAISTKLLYESGYQNALTLKGGFAAWRAAGQAVTKAR